MTAPKKIKGFSQLPHGFHKRIHEFNESRLKVWLAHRCMEGTAGTSYPGLGTLVQYTGLNIHTVTNARKWLRNNGWLVSKGQTRGVRGKFSVPVEHTEVPPVPVGENPTSGQTSSTRTVGGNPTSGTVGGLTASGPTACGPAASGNPTIEVDPKESEVDPKREVHPTNHPTEADGRQVGGENLFSESTAAGKKDLPLTEDVMLDGLQRTHARVRNKHNDATQGRYDNVPGLIGIPITPNITGAQELFDALRVQDITHVDQMNLVCVAYESWFESKYILSFDDALDAHDRKLERVRLNSSAKAIYIPEPIRCPLVMFRKELGVFLNDAREQLDELETKL